MPFCCPALVALDYKLKGKNICKLGQFSVNKGNLMKSVKRLKEFNHL